MEALRARDLAALGELSWLPAEYAEWLRRTGFGDLGGGAGVYSIYSAPCPLSEICTDAPPTAWTFGDDFSGCNGCFMAGGDGTVYEWDSAVGEFTATGLRFTEFIERWRQ